MKLLKYYKRKRIPQTHCCQNHCFQRIVYEMYHQNTLKQVQVDHLLKNFWSLAD